MITLSKIKGWLGAGAALALAVMAYVFGARGQKLKTAEKELKTRDKSDELALAKKEGARVIDDENNRLKSEVKQSTVVDGLNKLFNTKDK
jgi:hypothetical protein